MLQMHIIYAALVKEVHIENDDWLENKPVEMLI